QTAWEKRWKGEKAPLPLPYMLLFQTLATKASLTPASWLAKILRQGVKTMAKRFIAGESIQTSHQTLKQLRRSERDATLDSLGELVVSEQEADEYCAQVLGLIAGFSQHIPPSSKNAVGILCAHVSIKVS